MKRLWHTAINTVSPDPGQVDEPWQPADWIALVVVGFLIAAIIGFCTG